MDKYSMVDGLRLILAAAVISAALLILGTAAADCHEGKTHAEGPFSPF